MSHDQGPGVSMFQGAENLSLEINGKSPEEEEDIEDDNRRKEELHEILKSAFDDLNTDDDSSVADSSHFSGALHPHETSTACENIQPSISPCEVLVDYNKVIEFESGPGDSNTSHFCRNTSNDSHQISSTSLADKSLASSTADSSLHSSPPLLNHTSSSSTSASRKKAKQLAKQMLQQHTQQEQAEQQVLLQQELYLERAQKEHLEEHYQQTLQQQQRDFQQQQQNQLQQNHSPGGLAFGNSPQQQQQQLEPAQMLKFKQLEKQYEKRVREIEDLRLYIQQMDSKLDQEKSRMERVRAEEMVKQHTSEDEKKRVQVLEREIQELRENVNTLVRIKESTSKELDVSKITIYDLQSKIAQLESRKSVSKSMKSYESIIEQMKADYAKQEKYYQNVQTKVLSEFDRLKGELEKIRTEKDKMAKEITSSVDFIRTKLLDDPTFDMSTLKELELMEASDEDCGFSVMRTLQQFLRMKQCDIIKSLKTCRASSGGPPDPASGDVLRISILPNESEPPSFAPDTASGPQQGLPPVLPPPAPPSLSIGDLPSPPRDAPPSATEKSDRSGKSSSSSSEKNPSAVSNARDKSPSAKSPKGKSPAEQSARKANNNLAELNSILLDRLKKRESQLKSMTLECLNMSEVHFDSMKDVMNDFVRYHFAESLKNVSKPPKDTSAEAIAQMIDLERRKDDLLKDFLDNFRGFISDKKKEKLNQIREIQADFCSPADLKEGDILVQQRLAQDHPDPPEDDKQLLFDLKKMKDSFVNEINHVREELIKLDKENESLRAKCQDYETKNASVMEELASLKEQMGHQPNGDVASGSNNNKKKSKSKNNNNSNSRSGCAVVQSTNGTQTGEGEAGDGTTSMSLPDSAKPEDLAKLEKSLDMKLMYEKNELLKALSRAHNEIKSKESLLQRMECDYYDKILEIEQHSVDLYAEEVHKIEGARSAQLLGEIRGLKESLQESAATVKKQRAEIRQLRLRDTILSMENERLNSRLHHHLAISDSYGHRHEPHSGGTAGGSEERGEGEANRRTSEGAAEEEEEEKSVSAEKIDRIRHGAKFRREYEKLRDVCRQWSDEVRSLRSRLTASEKTLDAFRVKYKGVRKSALAYKKLAAEREKRLAEEKEAHRLQLDDIQFKMAKTVHKREAEINAKIAEIEKCNNEKLKVIMMMQRSAESGGGGGSTLNNKSGGNTLHNHASGGGGGSTLNNKSGGNQLNSHAKGVLTLSTTNNHRKCSNETAADSDGKSKAALSNGVEDLGKAAAAGKKGSKVVGKVNNALANSSDRSGGGKVLKKKKTEL